MSIDVIGRDSTDARLFAKLWRFVWYKDSGPTFSLTRAHHVEHQAYVLLLADRTGARLPEVLAAGLAGWRDDAIVAVRNPPGEHLSDLPPERLTDAVLDDAWTNLRTLARRAHHPRQPLDRQRRASTATARPGWSASRTGSRRPPTPASAWIGCSCSPPPPRAVGEDRALGAADRALDDDELVDLLAFVEPTALTSAAKRHVTNAKALLKSAPRQGRRAHRRRGSRS